MAEGGADREVTINTCSVCLETLREPRTLPCKHRFCSICLDEYIKSCNRETAGINAFPCPLCRSPVELSNKLSSSISAVTHFPLTDIDVDLPRTESESTTDKEHCASCERDDVVAEAELFCEQCDEKLCNDCCKYHRKNKFTSKHALSPLKNIYIDKTHKIKQSTRTCQQHGYKKIKYVCVEHDALCCSQCAIYEHKSCKTVLTCADYSQSEACQQKSEMIRCTMAQLADDVKQLKRHQQEQMSRINNAQADLPNRCQELKCMFDQFSLNLSEEVKDKCSSAVGIENVSKQTISDCTALLSELQTSADLLDSTEQHGTAEELIFVLEHVLTSSRKYDTAYHSYRDNAAVKSLTLNIDMQAVLVALKKHVYFSMSSSAVPKMERRVLLSAICMTQKGRAKQPVVKELILLHENVVVASDEANNLLLVYNTTRAHEMDTVELESEPWSLAKCTLTEFAVLLFVMSETDAQKVSVFIQQGQKISLKRSFATKHEYHALRACRYKQTECFVGFTSGAGALYFLKRDSGKELCEIKLSLGSLHFTRVDYISVCDRYQTLYASCTKQNKLFGINFDGIVKFVYSQANLKAPTGLTVNDQGDVFVCSYERAEVHKVNSKGQHVGVLLSHHEGLTGPIAVAYDSTASRLAVYDTGVKKCIKIFKM